MREPLCGVRNVTVTVYVVGWIVTRSGADLRCGNRTIVHLVEQRGGPQMMGSTGNSQCGCIRKGRLIARANGTEQQRTALRLHKGHGHIKR